MNAPFFRLQPLPRNTGRCGARDKGGERCCLRATHVMQRKEASGQEWADISEWCAEHAEDRFPDRLAAAKAQEVAK